MAGWMGGWRVYVWGEKGEAGELGHPVCSLWSRCSSHSLRGLLMVVMINETDTGRSTLFN